MRAARKLGKLLRLVRTGRFRRGLRHSVAAAIEHEAVLGRAAWRTIVDVGANRGQFALAARGFCPGARVHAFEPLEKPAAVFRRLFRGDPSVSLTEAAIGPRRQQATMHIARRDDSSSLLPISALQSEIFPGTEEIGTATVEVGPLDAFLGPDRIEPPALLKIDVQGYEREAIEGCLELLERFDAVYVECSFVELYEGQSLADELVAAMAGWGYRRIGMHNAVRDADGKAIQADFLFERADGRR